MPFTYTVKSTITLERAKRSKIIRSYLDQQSYVRILSEGGYWRPEGHGYTAERKMAWILDGETALKKTFSCGPEKCVRYETLLRNDERTQEEMGKPSIQFMGAVVEKGVASNVRFHYEVSQQLPPPSVGRSFSFDLYWNWRRNMDGKIEYTLDTGEPPQDLAQLARWHRAIAWALDNLPEPRLQIPMW